MSKRVFRFKRTLALIVCAAVSFTCAQGLSYKPVKAVNRDFFSYNASEDDVEQARRDRDEAKRKAEEAADKIRDLKGERSELSGELAELKNLSDAQLAQYEEIAEEYAAALIAKRDALDTYIKSQENLEAKRKQYSERISIMFAYENKSTLEILLSSKSIAGFFTNLELISLIGDADRQMIDQLTIAMDDAELKSQVALQEAKDMEAIAEEKQAELKELRERIGVTEEALDRKNSQLSTWQQREDAFLEEANRMDDEIRRLQRELEEQRRRQATPTPGSSGGGNSGGGNSGGGSSGGGNSGGGNSGGGNGGGGNSGGGSTTKPRMKMGWPYPGDYTIYSPYGMRFHPIYKVYKMHWGVDLGGEYGNPIVAAASGTVIKVEEPVEGQNTGGSNYGNYCVIDHGNGVSTAYAHCRDVYVHVGDTVKAGQTIAECGSTGASTGPHLHFEVRVDGEKVDPAPYIT